MTIILGVTLAGCSTAPAHNNTMHSAETPAATPATAQTTQPHHMMMTAPPSMQAQASAPTSCTGVDEAVLATMEAGGLPSAITISAAKAYKPAGESPYYVAARFTGESGLVRTGVWALNTLELTDAPRILSIDAPAQENTFWQEASTSELTVDEKSATRARECLK